MTTQERDGYKKAIDDLCELFDRKYRVFQAMFKSGEDTREIADTLYVINECVCELQGKMVKEMGR